MMHTVSTFDLKTLGLADMYGMYKLRYEVFAKKLGWDVETINEMEKDHYDDLPRVSYVLAKTASDQVAACWRILPTTGPYMLKDTFPELLHGQPAPNADDCWELSRFAVATSPSSTANGTFGPLSKSLMVESARFARENGISRYVTVTTPIMERMLKHQGVHIHRVGPSIKIGIASAVACIIEVDDVTLTAIGFKEHP
jgi:acyl homoserine lactone synthase